MFETWKNPGSFGMFECWFFDEYWEVEKSEIWRPKKGRIEKLIKIEKPPTFTFLFEFLPKLKKGHFWTFLIPGSIPMFFGLKRPFYWIRALLRIFFLLKEKFSKTVFFGPVFLPVISGCFEVNKSTSISILKNGAQKNACYFLALFEF